MQNDCNKCTFMAIIQTLTCTRQRPIPANQNTIFTNTDLNKKRQSYQATNTPKPNRQNEHDNLFSIIFAMDKQTYNNVKKKNHKKLHHGNWSSHHLAVVRQLRHTKD